MQYCINEKSFVGQFEDINDGKIALNDLVNTIDETSLIRNFKPILRTEDLKHKNLIGNLTLHEFLWQLQKSYSPGNKTLLQKILVNLVKGPYLKEFTKINELNDGDKACCLNTALHFAYDNETTHSIISIKHSKFNADRIELRSNGTEKSVSNYVSAQSVIEATWLYDENPKHRIPKDIIVSGNVWSKMALDHSSAQQALSSSIGIAGKRSTYACFNEQWFQFYNHHLNLYHGFPITDPGNDLDLNKVKKFIGSDYCWDMGQVVIS